MDCSLKKIPTEKNDEKLRMRDRKALMLYASAENRDWGVGRIEPRSSSSQAFSQPQKHTVHS
jgi:hypothetical protein